MAQNTAERGNTYASYDETNRVTTFTDELGNETKYHYNENQSVTKMELAGTSIQNTYNESGRLTEQTDALDLLGNIIAEEKRTNTPQLTQSTAYAYDTLGQLLSYREGQLTETYTYDILGNRTTKKVNGIEETSYQYNTLNQLTARTENGVSYSYGYDRRGNQTEEKCNDSLVRQYIYDAAGRMTLGKNLENGEKTEYRYNALNMRVKNTQTLANQPDSYRNHTEEMRTEPFRTKETSYVTDYLSAANNELISYEKGCGATRATYGRGYGRLSQQITPEPVTPGAPAAPGVQTALGVPAAPRAQTAPGVQTTPGAPAAPEPGIATAGIDKAYFQHDLLGSPLFASNGGGEVLRYAERSAWGDLKIPVQEDLNAPGIGGSLRYTNYSYDPVIGKHFAQARFYDADQGRMLARDPVKRGLNAYPYCRNNPVNYVDPTGEVVNILAAAGLGAAVGGAFGLGESILSQIGNGEKFDIKEALGSAVNGAIVGGTRAAVIASGAGLALALAANLGAGIVGSTADQQISKGTTDFRESITSGLTNAISSAIYGNNPFAGARDAFGRGATAGGATAIINNLSDALGAQKSVKKSSGTGTPGNPAGGTGASSYTRRRDPRAACNAKSPISGSIGYTTATGYQYETPTTGNSGQNSFGLGNFLKEVAIGTIMGGLSSLGLYGAGKAVAGISNSIKKAPVKQGGGNKGGSNKDLYRAVSPEEYDDVFKTRSFRGTTDGRTLEAKEFGNNLEDTLRFANHPINVDKAAILEVTIPKKMYNQLNHMNLDAPYFKSGTTIVEPDLLDAFNKSISNIKHVY